MGYSQIYIVKNQFYSCQLDTLCELSKATEMRKDHLDQPDQSRTETGRLVGQTGSRKWPPQRVYLSLMYLMLGFLYILLSRVFSLWSLHVFVLMLNAAHTSLSVIYLSIFRMNCEIRPSSLIWHLDVTALILLGLIPTCCKTNAWFLYSIFFFHFFIKWFSASNWVITFKQPFYSSAPSLWVQAADPFALRDDW